MSKSDYIYFSYDTEDIAEHITKLRKAKGISAYRLALDSGINKSILIRIENKEREPVLSTLLKIIDGLEMTPAQFFADLENNLGK